MPYRHYDRLSALDTLFLDIEDPNVHMHVGAVGLFDAGPLRNEDGHLDIERIRAAVESALRITPRFRQKVTEIPLFRHPVWVDDARFRLDYHVRHTALPPPGGVRLLKRLAGRLMSQKLDRHKPLWEMWVVEGVEQDRFAILVKAHHCMVDGISGIDLLAGMLRLDPDPTLEPARTWYPRPAPVPAQLLRDELWRRATFPLHALRQATQALGRPQELVAGLQEAALGVTEMVAAGLRPTSPTPLNPDIGPYRRFDWTQMELAAVKEIRQRLGGTLNDVVLACAAGAIGRFLETRGLKPRDLVFRAQVPVSIRGRGEADRLGNRIVMLLAELPLAERDPRRRLRRVMETTQRLKRSRQRTGVELLEELSDHTLTSLFGIFAQLATRQRSFNVVITNVPGPQAPVYLLGARMQAIHPLVPLAANQALGIALFNYDRGLYWGFNSDWDALPDLHELVEDVDREFEGLRKLAVEG